VEELSPQAKRRFSASINDVSGDRVANRGEVDSDLVRATGFELQPEQGIPGKALDDPEPGRRLSAFGNDSHLLPIVPVATNRCFDRSDLGTDFAVDKRQILFLDLPAPHLIDEPLVHVVG
jgi:hypothetical protein